MRQEKAAVPADLLDSVRAELDRLCELRYGVDLTEQEAARYDFLTAVEAELLRQRTVSNNASASGRRSSHSW